MENPIMTSTVKLLPQIANALPGVTAHAVFLGLPAGMPATMTAQETDLQTAQTQYLDKVEELKASQAAKRAAMKAGQALIALVRAKAKPTLGPKFSQNWAAFGFTNKLTMPQTEATLVSTLGTMAGHITNFPQFGGEGFDGAQAELCKDNITAAVAAVNLKKSEVRQKYNDRAAKAAAVRLSLRTVLSACRLKFDPLDGRWSEFGFNRPGVRSVPDAPTGITASLYGPDGVAVKWPSVKRAEYYRLWLRVVGQDAELNFMGTTAQLEHVFQNLPANSQVEVALSAANESGESPKSAVVTVLTQ